MTTFDLPPYDPGRPGDPAQSPSIAGSLAHEIERGGEVGVHGLKEVSSILGRVGEGSFPVRVSRRGSRYIIEKEQTDG